MDWKLRSGRFIVWRCFIWMLLSIFIQCSAAVKVPDVEITKATVMSSSKIVLSWKPDYQPKKGNLKYIIRYKEEKSRFQRLTSPKSHVLLRSLKPEVTYTIAVRAVRGKENGDWSRSVNVKTLPKNAAKTSGEDMYTVGGNVTVDEITTNSALVTWTLSVDPDQMNGFKVFRVVWKNKKKKKEEEMTNQNFTLNRLESNTRYTVNVYLFTKKGVKTKVGNAKFVTKEEQLIVPKNFRTLSITDTSLEVKWRPLDRINPDSTVSGYVLEYKLREDEYPIPCQIETNKTQKSYKVFGLLPDTKYAIRLAGKFDDVIGPFSDWLKIKTEPYNSSYSNIRIYHISSSEILTLWHPTDGYQYRRIGVHDIKVLIHQTVRQEFSPFPDNQSVAFWNELDPATDYEFTVSEFTSAPSPGQRYVCPRHQIAFFTTDNATCQTGCHDDEKLFSADVKGGFYDPYLRLLPVENANLVTWSAYTDYVSNQSYFYVIKVLGQPFLSLLNTYFIPIGQTHHVIRDLDPDKPYSISLVVFDELIEKPIFTSEYLLIIPTKDIPTVQNGQNETSSQIQHSVSSMDIYLDTDKLSDLDLDVLSIKEDIAFHQLDDLNTTLVSKVFPEDTFNTINMSTTTNVTAPVIHTFLQQVEPEVIQIENITVREGSMEDITCMSRGDPYPIITWINLSTNESIANVNSSERVYTTLSKYVGSVKAVNCRTFLGVKSFLTIKNFNLSDTGQYACAAENSAGLDMRVFEIIVIPKPPGPVLNLISSAQTPFEIRVTWESPVQSRDQASIGPIMGYRLELQDEYDVMMAEQNATGTSSVFTHLLPNTQYKVLVSAYHKYGEGIQQKTEAKTRRIPILGPAKNVSVVTLNSTIIEINWNHPLAVSSNQIHLRKYIIHVRKDGDRKSVERHIAHNVSDVVFRDLMPEQLYSFRIIGMSEDGQVSYSEWTRGSTYREAYMDETRPPPPPYNVYLRPASGNIIVSWMPPRNDDNIIVRGYAITVLNNGTKRESMEVGYEESSVLIYDVDMGIIYQISVQAKNKAGLSVEQWAELYIPEIRVTDEPVENFRGRGVSSTSIQLQWDPPGEGVYSHLKLAYINTDGGTGKQPGGRILSHDATRARNYIVRSLKPFTEYIFTITPYFKRMEGAPSNISVKTLSDRPSHAPEDVVLDSYNSTAVWVKCNPPSKGKNGVILTYKVSYRTKRTWRNDVVFPAEDDEGLNSYVTGLLPSTLYEFRVRALTVNGSGPWSPWQHIRTRSPDPIIPKVPQNMTSSSTKTSITLAWRPPDQDAGQITGYVVGYGKFIPEVYRASVTRDTTTYTINNLELDSMHIISVRSVNEFGESVATFDGVSIYLRLEPGSMYIISVRSFNEYGESVATFDVISTSTVPIDI